MFNLILKLSISRTFIFVANAHLAVGNGIMRLVAMLVKFQKLMVINYILACYCISVVRDFCDSILFTLQVTGGNRGIGYAIVKRLCKEFDGVVLFTGKIVS